ncbi:MULTISPECIES: hypothetical protein [unclassified Aurantimonas]|uniref:hypothetical protein n=1 Tax=unclassified Aurantimonas TaxID=2638230 RepID=UPI002E177A0D|nr:MULTISPECIES: hypothetical protein [unclassified Aurantimonas]MEC5289435.1 hypothetical protein [Aurantimonas sp. C2-3-R2]MEC5410515.1 hypothetical protein [Aurantimonas sp. C2-4-R8]
MSATEQTPKLATPLKVDPWNNKYANIIDAKNRPVCLDVAIDRARAIVAAVNAHAETQARVEALEDAMEDLRDYADRQARRFHTMQSTDPSARVDPEYSRQLAAVQGAYSKMEGLLSAAALSQPTKAED